MNTAEPPGCLGAVAHFYGHPGFWLPLKVEGPMTTKERRSSPLPGGGVHLFVSGYRRNILQIYRCFCFSSSSSAGRVFQRPPNHFVRNALIYFIYLYLFHFPRRPPLSEFQRQPAPDRPPPAWRTLRPGCARPGAFGTPLLVRPPPPPSRTRNGGEGFECKQLQNTRAGGLGAGTIFWPLGGGGGGGSGWFGH